MNAASAPMRTNSLFSSGSPWTEAPETVEPGDRGSSVRRGGAADAAGAVDWASDGEAGVTADVALSGATGCGAASATGWLPGRLRERWPLCPVAPLELRGMHVLRCRSADLRALTVSYSRLRFG